MKKMLALLATVSLTASSVATVGCTIGDNTKYNASIAIQRVILASSLQAKSAIVNNEMGFSAKWLLNSWGNNKVSDEIGSDFANELGGNNIQVKSLFTSVFGDKDYSINLTSDDKKDDPSIPDADISAEKIKKAVSNNLSEDQAPASTSPTNSIVTTFGMISKVIKIVGNSGIGSSIGSLLSNVLNSETGDIFDAIKDNIGILDTISEFLAGSTGEIINLIADSLSWNQFRQFITDNNSNEETLDNIDNITIEKALEYSYKNIAHEIDTKINLNNDTDPDLNLINVISKFVNNLIDGTVSFDLMSLLKILINPLITHLKIVGALYGDFDMTHSPSDHDHLYSTELTNAEYKSNIMGKILWEHSSVKGNSLSISGIFKILTNVLGVSKEKDPNGYTLQKVIFALIGLKPGQYETATLANPDKVANSEINSLIVKLGWGIDTWFSTYAGRLIDGAGLGVIGGAAKGQLVGLLSTPIVNIIESFAYNDNWTAAFTKLNGILNIIGVVLKSFQGLLGLNDDQFSFFEGFFNELKTATKNEQFLSHFNNMTEQLFGGNILNSLIHSFSSSISAENWIGFSEALEGKLGINIADTVSGVVETIKPYFDKLQNTSNISTLSITDLLSTFGVGSLVDEKTELGRILYNIKNYTMTDVLNYFNTFFNDDDINYKLHLGDLAYVVKALQNKVSINGNSGESIFDVIKRAVLDSSYKRQIRTVKFIGVGYEERDLTVANSELITISGAQTAMLSILGVKAGTTENGNVASIIEGSLISAVSTLMGPTDDWNGQNGRPSSDTVKDNSEVIEKIVLIALDLGKRFEDGNNSWIDDNITKYTSKNNWNIKLLDYENIENTTSESFIKYKMVWSGLKLKDSSLDIKTYTVTLKRLSSGSDIFNSQPWAISSLYDDSKPQK